MEAHVAENCAPAGRARFRLERAWLPERSVACTRSYTRSYTYETGVEMKEGPSFRRITPQRRPHADNRAVYHSLPRRQQLPAGTQICRRRPTEVAGAVARRPRRRRTAARAADILQVPRANLYRWQARLGERGLRGLEPEYTPFPKRAALRYAILRRTQAKDLHHAQEVNVLWLRETPA